LPSSSERRPALLINPVRHHRRPEVEHDTRRSGSARCYAETF
jgi:hypothetical protein